MKKCLEGSNAIAHVVNSCKPGVVSAYPITPQTHIVEDLSKLNADGESGFEFVRAESEFAAASIVLGASATGVRSYTATSSQGLLLMTEVLFTIAGMRLPMVMTCANRAVSAPINIWNDQQDSMTVRDSGWIMLYAEDNQEAVDLHPVAFKVSEQLRLPVMINVDGFILTHTYQGLDIPTAKELAAFLPEYVPQKGQILDVKNPVSLGCFATPSDYMEIREDLYIDLKNSTKILKKELANYKKMFKRGSSELVEYYGDKKAKTVFVAMGSVVGTIKDAVDELNEEGKSVAVVKVKCFRPMPEAELLSKLTNAKNIAVVDKSISLGKEGILATEIKSICRQKNQKIQSFITGLGGRDITKKMIKGIYKKVLSKDNKIVFVKK
ncbi:pyruvate ferredoxin oxidoreductase [Candidatus Falkowbacteria bacterium]|jgi:pyruvate ferredoxin oxidoreductase alpha subunit|nr:pyruvate ferredoxin oxidoreductase [Candidatus Falkowbacteria bacterium]MBT7007095.1 pyruvate ferredoxin oxidoreductase [Candidatus Falkowbacteria bacterium]